MSAAAGSSFLFKDQKDGGADLQQGDLLLRTDALKGVLVEAHKHYANAPDYSHFMILTQSCDLVRRYGTRVKAPYITVCAVRPFTKFLEKKIGKVRYDINSPLVIARAEKQQEARNAIEQATHFDVNGYFFIPEASAPTVSLPLCAFLPLSVALRGSHYDICLDARVGQLNDIFAAKIGWLAGNLYSRVATPDFESEIGEDQTKRLVEDLQSQYLTREIFWLSQERYTELQRSVNLFEQSNGRTPSTLEWRKIAAEIPSDESRIIDLIVSALKRGHALDATKEDVARKLLGNNTKILRELRRGRN